MTMVCDGPVIDSVTRPRHSSGKMSGSRNPNTQRDAYPEGTNGWHCAQPQSADVCYYCRLRFSPGQMRYRIMQALPSGWGPALLCMDCFKAETDESCLGYGATRHTIRSLAATSTSTLFAIHATGSGAVARTAVISATIVNVGAVYAAWSNGNAASRNAKPAISPSNRRAPMPSIARQVVGNGHIGGAYGQTSAATALHVNAAESTI
jgi:hypothetical protein